MLDHLGAIGAAQRSVRQRLQVREHVGLLNFQTLGSAQRDGFVTLIDAACRESGGLGGFEKLAASAADVENLSVAPAKRAT